MNIRRLLTPKAVETGIFLIAGFVLSGALVRVLSSGSEDLVTMGDPRYELALAIIYASIALIFLAHFALCWRATWGTITIPALVVLACVSAGWAEMPGLVLRRSVGVAGATLFGIVLACRFSFDEQLVVLQRVIRTAAILCIGAWILGHVLGIDLVGGGSLTGGGGPWCGIFNHKNMLGSAMALGILVEQHLPTGSTVARVSKTAWLLLYAGLLILSDSLTSVVALILTFGAMYAVKSFRGRYGLVMPAGFVAVLAGGIVLFLNADLVTAAMGRSSDLTGRAELWRWTTVMISQRPLLGYGFSGFWRGAAQQSMTVETHIGWSPIYAHNGYLEILVSLGFAGLVVFGMMAATGLRRATKLATSAESIQELWPLAFLIFFLLHNMGEVSIFWQNSLEWGLFVATVVGADPRLRARFEPGFDELRAEALPECA